MPTSSAIFSNNAYPAVHAAVSFLAGKTSTLPSRIEPSPIGQILQFTPNSEIYAEGDKAVFFYKVVSGVVRTCKFLSDGHRQIDAFYVAGDVFGFEASLEHGFSAEAVGHCKVLPYRRRGLEASAAWDGGMEREMFSYVMQCLERTRAHALLLGRGSAMKKLASFLLEMTDRTPTGEMIDLVMTRQDIADYLGLTIETVSRTLSQLEREGIISLSAARTIQLKNRTALRKLDS